ncbi:MAG: TetR family transcriptional regulator [Actinobacteria bacterium]|uniref:Unannotated protein n=1 Tax=freshwater metagenome TaxID=449393 RepID=A0A6J6AC84_9ZZZZ|nr:TetR family transcriptional regulator [Actinomycetota bacterium]MSX56896.1 TetR family transcriptional regulator [Actinomycetota bacterium]MSX92392.1 TetR family transcriptional regulator [Actinomycetota bacterium]MSZ84944.1 TetR family transcriptional regulator [Actinomycetota bacterium]MTB19828.1 TetR family transcriptional regulator [Actinomycetota bacterium]
MSSRDTIRSAKRPGPSPSLDIDRILASALRLLDRDGAKAFNMRGLAAELGVSPMTIYNYVPTKAALVTLVVDRVLATIGAPSPKATAWDDELRRYALEAWAAQAPHPWIPIMLAEEHLVEGPHAADSRRALIELFRAAGADAATSKEAVAAFFSFMIGSFMQVRLTSKAAVPERAHVLFHSGIDFLIDGFRTRLDRTS